ncbi:MAG: hypothetical protein ACI90V_007562 [Bacillariaceae sp.]|jgi:hypothetical protein
MPSPSQQSSSSMSRLGVRCSPVITDPSEFSTILLLSIRSLFGELESHSIGLNILKNISSASNTTEHDDDNNTQEQQQQDNTNTNSNSNSNNDNNNYQFIVECPNKSIDAIRASLTMVTTPSYLQSKIYRFDIINVE